MKKLLAALILVVSFVGSSIGQLKQVPLTQRVQNSNLIVEGKVLSHYSTWDNNNAEIYTVNKILISKVFKGSITDSVVNIITYGGNVGMTIHDVSNSLKLRDGEMGMFNLITSTLPLTVSGGFYEVYADLQGCLRYDKYEYTASGPFESYSNVDNVLYPTIQQATGTNYINKKTINWKIKASATVQAQFASKSITTFTPTTATAGTGTTITITGTNFGATQGTVSFSDANDGGATFYEALDTQVVSWNNTTIVVEVPSRAGTGPIRVETNGGGSTFTSSGTLTVPYSQTNVTFNPGPGFVDYPNQHIDDDGNGGYTWQYFTDFASNTNAVASFERALSTWTDTTCINWTIGATTTVDTVLSDGVNIVRFDNGSELPVGVLGRCTTRSSGCSSGGNIIWRVSELDIVFDDGTNWEFGTALPSFSEYDFESVAVHELGHGHLLGHVINTNMVMHYALSNGEANRDLANDEIDAGLDVMSRSTTTAVCGESLMTEHSSCAVACTDPTLPTLGLTDAAICSGGSTNLTITGTLNDATTWEVYTVSCGGTSEGSTSGSSISVSPTTTTTYFVRGEGGCVSPGSCSSITLTVNDVPDVSNTSSSGETCSGNDGTATVTPSGGSSPYDYTWDASTGNQTSQTAIALAAGTYGVVVTDDNSCSSSTTVTVNDDCSIPTTNLKPVYCGTTPGVNDYLQIVAVSGATNYEYEITNQTTGQIDTYYRGNGLITFRTSWIPSFDYGTTFSIRVRAHIGSNVGTFGTTCLVTTPAASTIQLKPAYCGYVATSMNDYIYSQWSVGAQDFRYRFSDQSSADVITYDRGVAIATVRLSWVSGLKYGTTYDVEVAAKINGSFGAFGSVCTVTTPSFPSTQLASSSCDIVLSAMNQLLYVTQVPGATVYQYEWAPQGGGTTLYYTKNSSQTSMFPYLVNGIQTGVVYDVRVRAVVSGDTGTFGNVCTVSTMGISAMPTAQQIFEWEQQEQNNLTVSNVSLEELAQKVDLSPNPNTGTYLKIDYNGDSPMYDVVVYDLTGKKILHDGYAGQYQNSTLINFNRPLSNGVYLVQIMFEDKSVVTKKLLVRNY